MKKIFNDLYHQPYVFLPAVTEEQYEKAIRKHDPKYVVNLTGMHGHTTRVDDCIFIWVRDDKLKGLGPLHHESIHAANYTLSDRGIKIDAINDEALTYLSQWIFEKCIKYMRVK